MDEFFTSTTPPKLSETKEEKTKNQSGLVWLGYLVAIMFLVMFVINLLFGIMSAMQSKPPSRQQQRRKLLFQKQQ